MKFALACTPVLILISAALLSPFDPSLAQAQSAGASIVVLPSLQNQSHEILFQAPPENEIKELVSRSFDLSLYRGVRAQVSGGTESVKPHLVVQLQAKGTHRVQLASVALDGGLEPHAIDWNYQMAQEEIGAQRGGPAAATCPDNSTEFIAFAPNDNALELQITQDVADSAKAHGLKTVTLLKSQATRQNYLNYMSCPRLKGNFYDGDSNPNLFITVDGVISAKEMSQQRFNHRVTNIWLACEAFNDPMLSSVTKMAQSQKYAAGVNDLLVGPSDRTAKCAMIAALDGKPMTEAFQECYKQTDDPADQWGFAGDGADIFSK
jgi:hypothetical protein